MSLVRCNYKEEVDPPSKLKSQRSAEERLRKKKIWPSKSHLLWEVGRGLPGGALQKSSHLPLPSRAAPPGGVGSRSPDTRTLEHSAPTPPQFLFQSPEIRAKLHISKQPTDDFGALISGGPFNLWPEGRRKAGQNGGRAASRPQKRDWVHKGLWPDRQGHSMVKIGASWE